jgi:ABC-type hemin transport system ATPase subunit
MVFLAYQVAVLRLRNLPTRQQSVIKAGGMDDVLLGIVLGRLEKYPLADEAADLLLAAFESEESLSVQLSGEAAERPSAELARVVPPEPAGAYLQSLTVGGFRGIGESATLRLQPGPGLTVVVGRNGSGKSSFAEALEVLLTGQLRRWEKLSAVWRQGWRSMHYPQAEITAGFLVQGAGPAVVQRSWPDGADFAASSVFAQVTGEKRAGLDRLGWSTALVDHRPFLSHSEIEAFFGSPSGLYELLASVLGLEDLNAAATRLRQARLSRESAFKEVRKGLPDLLICLEDATDERAGVCLTALSGRTWDLAAARQAATGVQAVDDGGELGRLRRLAQLTAPAKGDIQEAAASLRKAAAGLESVAGSSADRASAIAALLTAALELHEAHGDGDCPVCGRTGALTAEWRRATEQEVARLGQEAQAADVAQRAAVGARQRALALVLPPPPVLSEASPSGVDPGPASAAWAKWAAVPDPGAPPTVAGLRTLADHLEQTLLPLTEELRSLSAEANAKHAERENAWAPVAVAVNSWCAAAEAAQNGLVPVASIKDAESWLKAATDEIRNERLAPLAKQAMSIWAMLRQESNVDLGAIRLSGSSTQRHVELDVSVDGAPGSALGVMSQGEVNALALAVFLPRARLPASPFRFLMIDDPVQAMDPAKVDGLARVLEKAASDRQVIVFTHDNRLAQAVRQLRLAATVLEVTRRPGSVVEVRDCLDPVHQALRDAGALVADRSVPGAIAERVVPGLCRTAVEVAFTEAVWRRQLRDGRGHAQVEALLEEAAVRLTPLAALALTGDSGRGGDVLPRLNSWGRSFAGTYQALNRGAHAAHAGDLDLLIHDTRALVDKIGASLP